jgi:hypothetical protein
MKGRGVTPDQQGAELAVAWAHGEITLIQAGEALGRAGNSMYSQLANGLRDAIKLGLLVRPNAPKRAKI